MEEFTIEIIETEKDKAKMVLPKNYVSFGNTKKQKYKVFIKQDVYLQIEQFALENRGREVGTILLGEFSEKEKALVISNCIEAKYTESTAATLTFTHKTWEYVNDEKEKKYKDKKIVGWQHTHPGYGIFLSRYDLFIQENFFNLPWQVAYVVDPLADKRGFFAWENDEIVKLSGFFVYDEKGVKLKPKKDKKAFVQENFKKYIVQEGETLEKICEENNINYHKSIKKIKKINSLNDKEQLCEGQTLYLPKV